MNPRQHVFQLILKSDPRNIGKVEAFLREVGQAVKLDEIRLHKLMVALTEAVNNAILHGNKSNPDKSVALTCEVKEGGLSIRVRDQGGGFKPEAVENPLKEENLLRESGRGIFLMRTLMDKVEFVRTSEGMEVQLWLRLES
ncbi:MAG: ATP-binding protein [Bacteroidota bacterium]